MNDANVTKPKQGQRVMLFRQGKLNNLLPTFLRECENMGPFCPPQYNESWKFPLENGRFTTVYCEQESLDPSLIDGDFWLPLPPGAK